MGIKAKTLAIALIVVMAIHSCIVAIPVRLQQAEAELEEIRRSRRSATLEELLFVAATEPGKVGAVELLIANGANVNAREESASLTVLMRAIQAGRSDVVMLLIKRGADINAQALHGMTPLHHIAMEYRRCKNTFGNIAKQLVQRGASPFIRDNVWEARPLEVFQDEHLKQELLEEWRLRRATIGYMILRAADPDTELLDPEKERVPQLPVEIVWKILGEIYPESSQVLPKE